MEVGGVLCAWVRWVRPLLVLLVCAGCQLAQEPRS